jgi:hypothetical protein
MGRSDLAGKRDLWMRRMQRFARCQLTVAAFCDREQVSIAAFYQWRRKLQTKSGSDAGPSVTPASLITRPAPISKGFVPVQLLRPAVIEVRLGNGVTLTLPAGDLEALRQTLNIVSRLPADSGSVGEGE